MADEISGDIAAFPKVTIWGQNDRNFSDDIFRIFVLYENCCVLIPHSLKFVPNDPINNNPALQQIKVWRRTIDKSVSKPMMAYFTDAYMLHSTSMS